MEETRKMGRGDEEARSERREEKASNLVSKCAYFTWRDKLQHRLYWKMRLQQVDLSVLGNS